MTNREILAEHNARLSAIKAKIETGSADSATLVVEFRKYDYDTDDCVPRSTDGYYTINEGQEVFFSDCTSITISEGLYVFSRVFISIDCENGDAVYSGNHEGCVEIDRALEGITLYITSEKARTSIDDEW